MSLAAWKNIDVHRLRPLPEQLTHSFIAVSDRVILPCTARLDSREGKMEGDGGGGDEPS